ncbi:MAG: hypothetical protein QOG30_576 [Acidimicrobiaceae bacterium]|jgi:hypothetical protein
MTATTLTMTTTRPEARPASRQLGRRGAVAGVFASVATTGVAVAADAIGVPIKIAGESIPMAGFAQLTLFFSAVGIVMASVMARRSAHARELFVKTTLVLTALSIVPDVLADAQTATKLTLMLTHVVAAAIVIPALASRLAD